MNKKKRASVEWILLPILFSSAAVLAGSPATDPCLQCPSVMPDATMPLADEPPMSGDYVRRPSETAAAQAQALSTDADGFLDDAVETSGANMNFVGGNTRIGIGIDTEFKGRADLSHVFSETDSSVTSGQGWVGLNPKADGDKGEEVLTGVGVKLNHHWVATDEGGQPAYVHKVFGAYDQNASKDKKVTFGYGQEREDLFWSGSLSKGLSDKRESGTIGGQTIYEKAYDFGVGGRVGTFIGDQLMRVQGGLDYEWGTESADNEKKPSQISISGGVEKFFQDSPHSVGANIEVSKEQGGYAGDKHGTDVSGNVNYRYDFGGEGIFSADQKYRRVRVEIPGKTIVTKKAPKVERKLVKHTMELESDAFFEVGKFALTPEAQQRLRSVMARIRESGHEGNIRITGNTCDVGSNASNQTLSERRAAAVRSFMAANGFNPGELLARGLGETAPKYPNTDATRHKNRRVDIEYVSYETKYKDEMVEQGGEVRTQTEPTIVWRKELIPTPPTWVGQALRNNIQYKQSIDTYRTLGSGAGGNAGGNTPPVATNDTDITTAVGTAVTIDVLGNDTDADGDTLTIVSVSQPGHGSAAIVDGQIVYTPEAGYSGTDTFTYTISDGNGGTATGTVTVTVGGGAAGNAPLAQNDYESTTIGTAVTVNVLANDTDADGDTLSILGYQEVSAEGGTVQLVDGQLVYTPAAGFVGTDTFTYTITDGNGGQSTATVTITVSETGDNHAPTAVDDSKSTAKNTPVTINVLGNDYDLDGDVLTILGHDDFGTNGGSISVVDGQLVYTPADGFSGTDTFVYVITDNNGGESSATVTVVVSDVTNEDPVAVDDEKTTPMDTAVSVSVLANDTDAEGGVLSISSFDATSAQGGSVTQSGNNLVYTPPSGFTGTDTFNYTVSDGNGGEATASVTITVIENGTGMLPDDDGYKITASDLDGDGQVDLKVLEGDVYSSPVTIRIITHPSMGSITNVDGSGNVQDAYVTYQPNAGASGMDSFVYVLVDGDGQVSPQATVTIENSASTGGALTVVDDGVDGKDSKYNFASEDTTQRNFPVLGNDVGEGLVIIGLTEPRFGSAIISQDGQSIYYRLRSGYCEDHSFTYTVRDKYGNEGTATIYINID